MEKATVYAESSLSKASESRQSQSSLSNAEDVVDLEKQVVALPKPNIGPRHYWLRHEILSVYRRLFSVVVLGNIVALVILAAKTTRPGHELSSADLIAAAAINLLVSTLARFDLVVNALFWTASSVPLWAPFWIRKRLAKIYCYGGIHSGCGVAATIWYLAYAVLTGINLARNSSTGSRYLEVASGALTYTNILLLIAILTLSHPSIRSRQHNSFEAGHRFASWGAVALFWAQVVLDNLAISRASGKRIGLVLVRSAPFWCLILITVCLLYPWVRLRKRVVIPEVLSAHAIRLHFRHATPDTCVGIKLATSPMVESHAFATIPNLAYLSDHASSRKVKRSRASGFSVVISRAGDWTSQIIDHPPQELYTKGGLTYGVLRVALLFRPILVIATGSGIGPCLSLFQGRPEKDVRILWSTPKPLETFGRGIVDAVRRADPRATIWDTKLDGRPDLVALSWQICQAEGCEAAAIISNPKVTRETVAGLESRGIAAFAPIFDS